MNALILMTRIPIPGKTKTRLMEILSGDECAEIHKCFLMDLFNIFEYLRNDTHIFLTYTPNDSLGIIKDMIPEYIQCFPQEGKNLGEKMNNAIVHILNKGYKKVCLMGSDIPNIQPEEIRDAFEKLEVKDVVLGPTLDGGYYFIGMKKGYEGLFNDNLKWGYKTVLEGTIDIANYLGLRVDMIEKHRDIDTKEDLIAFKKNIEEINYKDKVIPKHTKYFLDSYWSDDYNAKRYIKG